MSSYHHFSIKLKAHDGEHTFGTVEMDGKPVHGVRDIKIDAGFRHVTEVTLTLIASVDAEFEQATVIAQDAAA